MSGAPSVPSAEFAEPAEPAESAERAESAWPARLRLLAVFALGGVCALGLLFPWRYPVASYALWSRLRYGGEPSAGGLVLTLHPCPPALRGSGAGPWVLAEFRDVSGRGAALYLAERAGEELSFEAWDAEGQPLAARADPARVGQARALWRHLIPPKGSLALPLDLSRWVEVPSEWQSLTLRLRRARIGPPPAGDGHTLSSLPFRLTRG